VNDDFGVLQPLPRAWSTAAIHKVVLALPDGGVYRAVFGMGKTQKVRYEEVKRYLAADRLVQATRHLCDRYRPEVVLAEYIFTTPCFDVVPAGVLKIVDTHDMFSRKQEQVVAYGVEEALPCTRREERRFLLKSDLVVAIQPQEARMFTALVPNRDVITVGIDYDVVDAPDDRAVVPGRVMVVGSDNPLNQHGLRRFLDRVWPAVRAAQPQATLRVVGKLANHVKTDDPSVACAGWVADLDEEYRRAQVVINPTLAGTGLKVKSVEAICRGKALVGTPNSVEGIESPGEPPYIVAPDEAAFASAVVDLLQSHQSRTRLERRAVDFAKTTFATESIYAPLGERLRAAMDRRRGGGERHA
jgi:glycosyltransferase involved in cell wall biosynthesis